MILSILTISCAAVSAEDIDDTIVSDTVSDSIDLESVDADDVIDDSDVQDSSLSAINEEESEDVLGAEGDMSDLAPMYEPDVDYSENHIYDISPSDDTREFLSHFREVSPGYTYANPSGKHPIDIFWTAVENNTIYFIFYMDEEDYKDLHARLTIDGIRYGDAGTSTDGQDHTIYISDITKPNSQSVYQGVTVVKFIDIPTTTTTGTLYVNRNHGDPVKDLPIKVLNQTDTILYVDDKFNDTIYLGQDANLSAFVTLLNFVDVKVTEGTVHYYLISINDTKLETPIELGTTLPGDNPGFEPLKFTPDGIGNYTFKAWYEDYEDDHNFESHSNTVILYVIEPPKTDLSIEKTVDNESPKYGTDVTYTITVTNNGPNDATGVKVTDKLPEGLAYVSDDSNGKYDPETGIWDISDLANEATATLKIIATVNSLSSINNTANVTCNEEDTDSSNDEDSVIVKATPVIDLEVSKEVDNDAPDFGTDVTFTITVKNNGPCDATGVEITDKLPDGLAYVSDDSEGKYDPETGVWNINNLANGSSVTLKIIATVNSVNSINNTAKVTNSNEEDNVTDNDEDSVIVTAVPIIDLEVLKEVDNDAPDFGSDVTYTITVTNNGPCDATGVKITDKLPDGLIYVSDDSNGKYDPETGVWDIGALNNQSTVALSITATINSTSEISNIAKVNESNEKDNDTDNDESTVTITPRPVYDVAVTIEITNPEVYVGEAVEYIITVTNNGPCTAYNVIVKDVLPDGFSYLADNSTGDEEYLNQKALYASVLLEGTSSFDQSTGTWTVGDLESGDTQKLKVLAKAGNAGEYTISDSVTADDFDLDTNDDNNQASADVTVKEKAPDDEDDTPDETPDDEDDTPDETPDDEDDTPDETPDETDDEVPEDETSDETPKVSKEIGSSTLPQTGNPILVLLFALIVLTGAMFERKE